MNTHEINENNLVAHLIRGNETAYSFLIDLYYNRLCAYASSLTRDSFFSEDIVQNVIVKLWQHRHKLHPDISIKNYLYKSVYNEFVDYYRKNIAVTALEKKYIDGLDTIYQELEQFDDQTLKKLIESEIALLPRKCKETFLLSKRDGLTYNEIAEYKKISVNTVENHMAKALMILRVKLKGKVQNFFFFLFGNSAIHLNLKKN